MLNSWLMEKMTAEAAMGIGMAVAFVITFVLMWKPFKFLPKDGGKKVETPDGEIVVINDKSTGKVTGIGVVFVPVFLLVTLLILPLKAELLVYAGLMFLLMITGFLDDASTTPWGELAKGFLDLVVSVGAVVTYLSFNEPVVTVFGNTFHMPIVLYGILAVFLIWGSINVTNCSDGVDGLCGSVSVVELIAYYVIFRSVMPVYGEMGMILAAVLLAYLIFNWNPSKVLMGDAGSRPIGFLLALLAIQSGRPFLFLVMSLVFILDGGLGLLKMTMIRVLKFNPMKNLITPPHDHFRKKLKVKPAIISASYAAVELVLCFVVWLTL